MLKNYFTCYGLCSLREFSVDLHCFNTRQMLKHQGRAWKSSSLEAEPLGRARSLDFGHVAIYRFRSRCIWSITNSHFLSLLFASRMVHYKLSLVWGFPFFIVFVCIAYGLLQTVASVGLSVFIVFVRVAYGPLQTFRCLSFCSHHLWYITNSH